MKRRPLRPGRETALQARVRRCPHPCTDPDVLGQKRLSAAGANAHAHTVPLAPPVLALTSPRCNVAQRSVSRAPWLRETCRWPRSPPGCEVYEAGSGPALSTSLSAWPSEGSRPTDCGHTDAPGLGPGRPASTPPTPHPRPEPLSMLSSGHLSPFSRPCNAQHLLSCSLGPRRLGSAQPVHFTEENIEAPPEGSAKGQDADPTV